MITTLRDRRLFGGLDHRGSRWIGPQGSSSLDCHLTVDVESAHLACEGTRCTP